jgi:hypothetical protein
MSLPPSEIPLGAMRFNSDSQKLEYYDGSQWLQVSTFSPNLNGGARGVFGLTYNPSINNTLNYLTISSTGNALDFGDLSTTRHGLGSAASNTRGVFYAGEIPPGNVYTNTIDYITISSTGNSIDFGDASGTLAYARGVANSTRGIFGGGRNPSITNTIEYITIASTGDTKDFGDLTQGREGTGTFASSVRGVYFGGGVTVPVAPGTLSVNTVDYITLSTLSNATDFGDLTEAVRQTPGASNATRGLRFGGALGPVLTNTMDYTQISTLGNFSNFGDLISASGYGSAAASSTRIVLGTGYPGSYSNSIEYVTVSTLGNSVDFGDFTQNGGDSAAVSNAHGGL